MISISTPTWSATPSASAAPPPLSPHTRVACASSTARRKPKRERNLARAWNRGTQCESISDDLHSSKAHKPLITQSRKDKHTHTTQTHAYVSRTCKSAKSPSIENRESVITKASVLLGRPKSSCVRKMVCMVSFLCKSCLSLWQYTCCIRLLHVQTHVLSCTDTDQQDTQPTCSKCAMSLWRYTCNDAPPFPLHARRAPSIMLA